MKFYILCSYNCDARYKKLTESANTVAFLVLVNVASVVISSFFSDFKYV